MDSGGVQIRSRFSPKRPSYYEYQGGNETSSRGSRSRERNANGASKPIFSRRKWQTLMLMLMLLAAVMAMTLIMGSYILSMGIILNREKKYEYGQVRQQEHSFQKKQMNVRGANGNSIHIEESSEGRV